MRDSDEGPNSAKLRFHPHPQCLLLQMEKLTAQAGGQFHMNYTAKVTTFNCVHNFIQLDFPHHAFYYNDTHSVPSNCHELPYISIAYNQHFISLINCN